MHVKNGKYGDFYFCPNGSHGTISLEKYKRLIANFKANKSEYRENTAYPGNDPLMTAIEMETIAMGGGIISELVKFYIDNPEQDQEDSWQDIRPY